jgi:hypothetical protein
VLKWTRDDGIGDEVKKCNKKITHVKALDIAYSLTHMLYGGWEGTAM